jgi:hypothetical protein
MSLMLSQTTAAQKRAEQTARALGLTQFASGIAYGTIEGHLAQVRVVANSSGHCLEVLFRHAGEGKEETLRRAVDESPEVKASGIKSKLVGIGARTLTLAIPPRFIGLPDVKVILQRVHAVLAALRSVSSPGPAVCGTCGSAAVGEPALVHGVADRICASCIERLEHESQVAAAEYHSRSLNLPLGLGYALVAGAAGGAIYAAVMVATHRMLWMLAVLTGVMVGYAAAKGAGKGGPVVQAMAAVVTVVSVLAGLLGFIAYQVHEQVAADGATVDWALFLAKSPQVLISAGSDSVFSLAGGLFGAIYAIQKARPPQFQAVQASKDPAQGKLSAG